MNAFHVIGGVLVLWAVTLSLVGIRREGFPRTARQALAVATISVLLAGSAIASGIVTSALEEEEEEEEERPLPNERGGSTLRLGADPGGELSFDRRSLEAHAGQVMVVMDNPSSVPHNVSVEGRGVDEQGETVGEGGTSTVRADLRPGTYRFYCSVQGHRQAGMEGTLTVK